MNMGKEFYENMEAANSKYRSLKIMAMHEMESLQQTYPKDGYKWRRCQKVIDRLREETKR